MFLEHQPKVWWLNGCQAPTLDKLVDFKLKDDAKAVHRQPFDLSAYEGEDVRIAFYTDTTDQWAVFIDDFQVTSFSSLGTNTPDQSITFEYFPNPVEDELTLKAQANIDSIEVLNILGQSLISLSPSVMEAKVDMSSLQTGAYFVRLSVQETMNTFRVLKN